MNDKSRHRARRRPLTRRPSALISSEEIPNPAVVWIDRSQSPEAVSRDLARSLRTRRLHHKFHYDSVKQTVQWLALHDRYSPFRNDPFCRRIYQQAADETTARIRAGKIHVIGLGCGSGDKDIRLVQSLHAAGKDVYYTPSDASTAMALVAWRRATRRLRGIVRPPLVCDLATTRQLSALLLRVAGLRTMKLITFFGMIPNFEVDSFLPKLARSLTGRDLLLASANLLPGPDPTTGLRQVLPQYDNPLTCQWLFMALSDLGVENKDGRISFLARALTKQGDAVRIEAHFRFRRSCSIRLPGSDFEFRAGESLRLFFSNRYTAQALKGVFARQGFQTLQGWITPSAEEGVFLLKKA